MVLVRLLGAVRWLGAAIIFGITVAALRDRVLEDGPIRDVDWRINDATVIDIVPFVQIGYPVISLRDGGAALQPGPRLAPLAAQGCGLRHPGHRERKGLAIYEVTRAHCVENVFCNALRRSRRSRHVLRRRSPQRSTSG